MTAVSPKNSLLDAGLMSGVILLILLILPAISLHRGNVIGMPASLVWSVGGAIFVASFLSIVGIARSSRIDKITGGAINQQISVSWITKYSFLGALAGVFAVAGYWNTVVLTDFLNRTPHKEIVSISSVEGKSRVCDYEIRFVMSGEASSLCTHYPFSMFRLPVGQRLMSGDKVELVGRKSWAGFAVDNINPITPSGR